MASLAFDTLDYARRLEAVGVPRTQAEVQAQTMGQAFGYYVDNLVTKDYLDARLAEQEARIETRFAQQDARIDARFAEQDARFDRRFERIEGVLRLHSWMLLTIAAAIIIPAIKSLAGF